MPAQWKHQEVESLKKLIKDYSMVGIVGIRSIPGPQMQDMRIILRGKALLKISKSSLIQRALENGFTKLKEYIEGEVGLIVSNMNPFKLYKELDQMRMKAPAKAGDIAPDDITIKKGDTAFKPGPVVGDLQKVGIPAAIREGKVVIEKDVTLIKKGEQISENLAKALTRLDVKPIDIGLKVYAIFEDNIVFTPEVLTVDTNKIFDDIQKAVINSLQLSIGIVYPTKITIEAILQKAYMESFITAMETTIYNKKTMEEFIRKAYLHAKVFVDEIGG
jgi:large subunit ribosomal protein L10